jgi:hypothetical protein
VNDLWTGGSFPIRDEEEIRISKELARIAHVGIAEAIMEKDKHLTKRVDTPQRVDIPPGMTVEHYHGMNIASGHRIGWEYKQQYLAKLGELYAEGYLTEDEYDKRAEWVNEAKTSEQIDLAFLDLQKSLLSVKVNEYLKPKEHKDTVGSAIPVFMFMMFALCISVEGIAGSWIGFFILLGELLAIIFFMGLGHRYRTHKKT